MMKRIFLFLSLLLFAYPLFSQTNIDTLSLYFASDEYKTTTDQDLLLKKLAKNKITEFQIIGYTDSIASHPYNQELSNKRAYYTFFSLLKLDYKIELFKSVKGFGEISSDSPSLASCRKVDIIYSYDLQNKNHLEELISTSEKGDRIIFKNILFEPGNHLVLPQSEAELNQLFIALNNNPLIKIEIQGHICCQFDGQDGFDAITRDKRLSWNRAQTVYYYLIKKGIDKNRLSYKGFGSSQKIFEIERNEQEKTANRRVEIIILEN